MPGPVAMEATISRGLEKETHLFFNDNIKNIYLNKGQTILIKTAFLVSKKTIYRNVFGHGGFGIK